MLNNADIRALLLKRGIKPEELPPEEDVQKLERKVKKEEKQIAGLSKKKQARNNAGETKRGGE